MLNVTKIKVIDVGQGILVCMQCELDFGDIWPWVKVMAHPWAMDNNCVECYLNPTIKNP